MKVVQIGIIQYGEYPRLTKSCAENLSAVKTTGPQCDWVGVKRQNLDSFRPQNLRGARVGIGESDVNESKLQQLPIAMQNFVAIDRRCLPTNIWFMCLLTFVDLQHRPSKDQQST